MDFSQYQGLSMDTNVTMSFQGDSSDSIDVYFQPNCNSAGINPAYLHPYYIDPAFYEQNQQTYFTMSNPSTPETPAFLPTHLSQRLASPFSERSAGNYLHPQSMTYVYINDSPIDAESISEFELNMNSQNASASNTPIMEERPLQSMKQIRRQVREHTYMDANRRNAADTIVKHMLSEAINANQYYNTQYVPPLPVLQNYIENLDSVTRTWVEEGSQRPIGTESNRVASDARKEKPTPTLYICRWCWATFTVKHNLATHVRAHLDLHVSFCNRCEYSSTSATIPARHRKACEAKRAKFSL